MTLEAVGEGSTVLDVTPPVNYPIVADNGGNGYGLTFLADAEVMVGAGYSCSGDGSLDNDGDAFADGVEQFVTTNALSSCPQTAAMNDEAVDAWPPDFNDDRSVGVMDLLSMGPSFKTAYGSEDGDPQYSARFDLDASGDVDVLDLMGMGASFKNSYGDSCVP
jgi:hypothetical protein